MVAIGHVRNGVIVLENEAQFAEGQKVMVVSREAAISGLLNGATSSHSILDIPAVDVGDSIQNSNHSDDILGEMLEGRL